MGQQVPFETMDSVYNALVQEERAQRHIPEEKPALKPRAIQKLHNGKPVRRLEVTLNEGTPQAQPVHIYEAYWAPIMEGEVTLRDVLAFVWTGAINGLFKAAGRADRWLFGAFRAYRHGRALLQMVLTALVAVSILALGAIAGLGAAARGGSWTYVVSDATWLAFAIIAPAVVLGTATWLSGHVKARWYRRLAAATLGRSGKTPGEVGAQRRPVAAALLDALGAVAFWLFVAAASLAPLVAIGGAVAAWKMGWDYSRHAMLWPLDPAFVGATWVALAGVFLVVRRFLVQALGDVAAYVSTHKLDRFNELRAKVKQEVRTVAEAIYDEDVDGTPYEGVYIVGHSLGSAVAYDALNGLIFADTQDDGGKPRDVLGRTKLLLTFGSPLAKLAFMYGTQRRKTTETREAMAAAVQPLIQSYDNRTMDWVNVRSPSDVIAGHLGEWFDQEESKAPKDARRVVDVRDVHVRTPLMAHNEYWRTPTVWRILRERLVE